MPNLECFCYRTCKDSSHLYLLAQMHAGWLCVQAFGLALAVHAAFVEWQIKEYTRPNARKLIHAVKETLRLITESAPACR